MTELNNKIQELEKERIHITTLKNNSDTEKNKIKLGNKLFKLDKQLAQLYKVKTLAGNPNYSDNEIDLYLYINNEFFQHWFVTLKTKKEIIGEIRINFKKTSIGDISYIVEEKYRGHDYALKSLILLKEEMKKKGLIKPNIRVNSENIASKKTIENFGGYIINKGAEYLTYEIDLKSCKK